MPDHSSAEPLEDNHGGGVAADVKNPPDQQMVEPGSAGTELGTKINLHEPLTGNRLSIDDGGQQS